MADSRYEELIEKLISCIENRANPEESSLKMKAGTVIAIIVCAAVLLGGWLGTIQMVQASHSEAIGGLKAAQDKTDQQYSQIMAAVKRLEDIQMGRKGQ